MAYNDLKRVGWSPGPDTKPSLGMRKREDNTFLMAVVTAVDDDRQTMDVQTYGGYGSFEGIPITHPYAGTNSYIAAMPQIGSRVILANEYNLMYPIFYLPDYIYALDGKNVKTYPEGINLPQSNELVFNFPKLKRGDIAMSSSNGAEVTLNERYAARHLDVEFIMDGLAGHTISSSASSFMFSGGVWQSCGIVTRNLYDSTREDESSFAETEITAGGAKRTRLPFETGGNRYFSEYLIEVEDLVTDETPKNEVNSGLSDNNRNPAAVLAMGNLVGNNSSRESYGQILKANLFSTADDREGLFSLDAMSPDDAQRYGMAVSIFAPNRRNPEKGGFIGIDKEGHLYMYAPSGTGGGIGKGRSMSILADGSKKEVYGRDSKYGASWDLSTRGGLHWSIGDHNDRIGNPYAGRSIDIRTSGTAFYMYGAADPDVYDFDDDEELLETLRRYRKIEKVDGGERVEIGGNREALIESSDLKSVGGMHREGVAGAYTLNVGQDMNVAVASVYAERAVKEKQETYGSRLTTVTSGDSELEVNSIVGNITESITKVGSRETSVRLGKIKETIRAGDRETKITAGDSETSIKLGDYKVAIKSGNVDLSTKVGSFTAKSKFKATVKASLAGSVNVEGGSIKLKSKERLMGGVITEKTHFDYVTGAPLVGSKTVKAAGLPG